MDDISESGLRHGHENGSTHHCVHHCPIVAVSLCRNYAKKKKKVPWEPKDALLLFCSFCLLVLCQKRRKVRERVLRPVLVLDEVSLGAVTIIRGVEYMVKHKNRETRGEKNRPYRKCCHRNFVIPNGVCQCQCQGLVAIELLYQPPYLILLCQPNVLSGRAKLTCSERE